MMVTARIAMIGCAVFSVVCLGVAIDGFWSLSDIADPVQASDARGFAWFWAFLGVVVGIFGVLSWRIDWNRHRDGGD